MGLFNAVGSLFSKKAWVAQYVENFQGLLRGTEIEHPTYPRCANLAIAWAEQFNLPFCPVPRLHNSIGFAKMFASFYSCLDKPFDGEALGLHAVLEAKFDKTIDKARRGDGGVKITDFIGEQFGERYKLLTRQIFEDFLADNYGALEQKFATRNPTGSRYFAVVINRKLAIKKLPDTHEPTRQSELIEWQDETVSTFGIAGLKWDRIANGEIRKWSDP